MTKPTDSDKSESLEVLEAAVEKRVAFYQRIVDGSSPNAKDTDLMQIFPPIKQEIAEAQADAVILELKDILTLIAQAKQGEPKEMRA